jgi:hypothetical protein
MALGPTQPCIQCIVNAFPAEKSCWSVQLTTHLHNVPGLRVSSADSLFLHVFMGCVDTLLCVKPQI